jgi:hypothetical protein
MDIVSSIEPKIAGNTLCIGEDFLERLTESIACEGWVIYFENSLRLPGGSSFKKETAFFCL